jgi:hypothetical protein|tara:strand:+ start:69 stop:884 length:816 start_codon:yes stop_codon:yes gene_type:complete
MSDGFGELSRENWDEEILNKLIYQSGPECGIFTIDWSHQLGFTTYHTSWKCPKNLDGCMGVQKSAGWLTDLESYDIICKECEGRCSMGYEECTGDGEYSEEINDEIIDYCTNCWNKDGTFEIKECQDCSNRENVGLWPTIVNSRGEEEDTTDLCSDCYGEQVTLYARERDNIRIVLHKCFCCEEVFGAESLVDIPFCEHLDNLSIVNSTISSSKYCCIDCLEEDCQDDYSNLFAVDSIISPREIKIHFGSLYELLIEGDGFRIYKMKDSHN